MSELPVETSSEDEELELRVWHLRRGGLDVRDIARKEDISVTQVIEMYNAYRRKLAHNPMTREEAKELLTARYEGLISGWYEAAVNGDEAAVKAVIPMLRDEMKLWQLDQLDPADRQITQNILVVGNDKKAFIEALQQGRGQVDGDEIIVEEEEPHE